MLKRIHELKAEKGFTLIELLIVVAIIGILAAIAIPQFAQYRMRSFNSAGQADLRNARTSEEALFADFQEYGDSGGLDTTNPVTLTMTDAGAIARTVTTGLSNSVSMEALTENAAAAGGASYLIFTKHTQGDREFGADSDATALYWCQHVSGTAMVVSGIASATPGDQVIGATPAGCTAAAAAL